MTTYFLSYARADAPFALRLADGLIGAGVSVWVDQYDIRPSQHWDRAIETALRACRGLIVILSPRSVASPNVADEVSVALNDGKTLIPVLMEPCTLPLRMTRMQYIDATGDYDAAFQLCLAALSDPQAPPPLPEAELRAESPLPSKVLRDAERRLMGVMGPIASVLVRQAAARATSEADLYRALAAGIAKPADRESFLGWIGEPSTSGRVVTPRGPVTAGGLDLSSAELQAITTALIHHLGPIASRVIARERPAARSRQDLCERLAARIADEKHRAAFLRETQAG